MNIKNKVIIVTGASEGIGKAIALRLAKEKVKLALIARNQKKLGLVTKEIIKLGSEAKSYSCDITKTKELITTVNKIKSDFNQINILINNAGIWHKTGSLTNLSSEKITKVINTNLTGLIQLTNLVLKELPQTEESAIINISSKSGTIAQAGQSVYTASKYGVKGFTDVLKLDLKGIIRVAGVYQSGTNTDMFTKAGETFSTEKFTDPNDLADVIAYMLMLPKKIWLNEVHINY